MHITKFWRAISILALLIIVFAASRFAQAGGVQEWLCRLVNYQNCEQLTKLIASRAADGEYATSVVIYDSATGSRKVIACGRCRDPLPIAASQIAVRTESGLAVLPVDDRAVQRTFVLPGVRHLLAVDPATSNWVVALGGDTCPQLALFDPSTGQVSRAGVPDQEADRCPLPRPGRIMRDEQIFLAGDRKRSVIFARPIDRPAADSRVVVPRAPNDDSVWFDPQWFADEVIYATQ